MIRKLRTERDNQQWMLDLALNMRGRVQNFERDDSEVPSGKRARNYRMLPKVWREAAERHEAFFGRLRGLNDRRGYPKRCRLVAVANSSRGGASSVLKRWAAPGQCHRPA